MLVQQHTNNSIHSVALLQFFYERNINTFIFDRSSWQMFSIETGNRGYFYLLFSRSKHSPSWTGDSSVAFPFSTRRSKKFHLSKHLKSNSTCPLQRIVHCGPATREDCRPARSKIAPTPLNHHQHPCIQSTCSPPFRTTHRHLKRTLTS